MQPLSEDTMKAIANPNLYAGTPEQALNLLALVALNCAYAHSSDPRARAICLRLIREINPHKPLMTTP